MHGVQLTRLLPEPLILAIQMINSDVRAHTCTVIMACVGVQVFSVPADGFPESPRQKKGHHNDEHCNGQKYQNWIFHLSSKPVIGNYCDR